MVQQVQPATPHATSRAIQTVLTHLWRRRRMASAPSPDGGAVGPSDSPAPASPFISALNAEFYRRGFVASPERYAWVTIGGKPEGGKQHVGGTPVNIGQGGEIKAGPAGLKGKDLDDLDRNKQGTGATGKPVGKPGEKPTGKFNPDFAGRLLVWHDPADNQNYVINGHHRHELAERTGYNKPLSVRFIDAENEKEAKARGALANIAGGKGTALDAANFLRETGGSMEMMEEEGISLEGAIASNAVSLSHLSDDLFKRLHSGLVREGRALAIARNLEDPTRQDSLYRKITEKEKTRKNDYTDREVAEMAKKMDWAGSRTVEGTDLFGSFAEEKDTFLEESELQSGLRSNLSKAAKHFKNVASAGAQAILEEGGHNKLEGGFNAQQAAITKRLEDVFDIEARHRGPLTDAIKQAALELSDDPKRKSQIVRDLTSRATAILREILGEGVSGDVPSDGEGPGEHGGGGEERESSAGLRSGGGSGGEGGEREGGEGREKPAESLREHFRRENQILKVVARYQRNHLLAWSDECLADSPTAIARRKTA